MTAGGDSDTNVSLRPLDAVSMAALFYLALPLLVFLTGWLKPAYAAVAVALLGYHLRRSLSWSGIQWRTAPPLGYLLAVVALAAAWTAFGGAGHFFHANVDWQVRDGVYGDLIRGGWPVSYAVEDGVHRLLRSAIGYFLPPAGLAKLIGLQSADILLWLWTLAGATLFLLLLPVPWRVSPGVLALLLVAVLFSGMDALGVVLTAGYWPIFPLRIEWWVPLSYSSITGMLYWAPNHALPLLVSSALFFRHWRHPDFFAFAIVMVLAGLIWTPFVLPALAPFLVLLVIDRRRAGVSWSVLLRHLALPALVAWPIVRFLTLDLGQLGTDAAPEPGALTMPRSTEGFLSGTYAPFVLMEFAILAALLHLRLRHSLATFRVAVAVLFLLPFLSVGPAHDILLRFSTPALVMLLLLTLVVLQEPWQSWRDARSPLLVVLLVGSVTPIHEIWRGATWRHTPPDYAACNLVERLRGNMPTHYVGRLAAADLAHLLREPQLSPAGPQAGSMRPCPLADNIRPAGSS